MQNTGDIRIDDIMPFLNEAWERMPFAECLIPPESNYRKLKQKELRRTGLIPVIDQGEDFIAGYTDKEGNKYPGSLPIVIFGDHTRRVKYVDFEFAVGAEGIKVLHPFPALHPRFFYYYLTALKLESQGYSRHFRFLREIDVPIPPLNEQRRIVAKLEKLLNRVDAAQSRLATIPRILKRFRQSVLAAACSGRLTADWREQATDIESSQALIKRMKGLRESRHKEERKIALADGRRQPPKYDNIEPSLRNDLELFVIPDTWEWVDLRFLMNEREAFCYGVVQPGDDSVDGVPLIRVCDLENGSVNLRDLRNISKTIHEQYERSGVKGGEVIVTVVGTIGRAAIVPKECAGFNIARAIAKIPIKDFEPRYVLIWLTSTTAEQWMIGDAREVARKTLNLEQLRTLPIPLPPILEQQEIVHRVEVLFKTADALEARYRKAKGHVDKLTQSILAKAFRGELVPQDPTDEPASLLLEQLRKGKSQSPDKKQKPRLINRPRA